MIDPQYIRAKPHANHGYHIYQTRGPQAEYDMPGLLLWPPRQIQLWQAIISPLCDIMPIENLGRQAIHLSTTMHHPQQALSGCHTFTLEARVCFG